jgi:hypothetical protein
MDATRTIVYRGKPPWHTALVQFLEEEGVHVEWSPPAEEEPRGLGADAHQVVVSLITTGTTVAIAAAVRRFRKFGPKDKGEVEVKDDGGGPDDAGFLDE